MNSTNLFKRWSIKELLQLWSLATLVAIAIISLVSLYSNEFFFDSQEILTEQVLPLESASRQLSVSATAFISRQEQVIVSQTLEDLTELKSRQKLEEQFDTHWRTIATIASKMNDDQQLSDLLYQEYQQFLVADTSLLKTIEARHRLEILLVEKSAIIEGIEDTIQTSVEMISGHVNLNLSRYKRSLKASIKNHEESVPLELLEFSLSNRHSEIQKLSQLIRLNVLNITLATQRLLIEKNPDVLLSIRENHIRQDQNELNSSIKYMQFHLANGKSVV